MPILKWCAGLGRSCRMLFSHNLCSAMSCARSSSWKSNEASWGWSLISLIFEKISNSFISVPPGRFVQLYIVLPRPWDRTSKAYLPEGIGSAQIYNLFPYNSPRICQSTDGYCISICNRNYTEYDSQKR